MPYFLRIRYSHMTRTLCSAAIGLSVVACGTDPVSPTRDDESSTTEDDDNTDEAPPKKDAGKPAAAKPDSGTKKPTADAGADTSDEPTGKADAGKEPTTPAAGEKSLFCDALAVFEKKCNSCHGDPLAAGAPMSLLTYADVSADAPTTKGKKVHEVVGTRVHDAKNPMPPGKPMGAEDLAPIDAWLEAGAPDSDTACETKAAEPKPTAEWPPAGCDEMYKLQAGNGSKVMVKVGEESHPQFVFDAPWGSNDVQAIAFRPITDNAAVLHHWILYSNTGNQAFISGWAPGQDESELSDTPADVGFFLPKGAKSLRLDMHYNNLAGKEVQPDQSGVEICVTKNKRKHTAATYMGFAGIPFIAPGQETDIVGTCNVAVTQPVFLMSQSPHAHQLATHMKLELKRDGKVTTLHDAPFAFDGQVATPFAEQVELKNGDQVITTCHFKNDTNQLVTFGEDTGNEMCFNFTTYYPMGALSCSGQAPIDIPGAFGGGN